MIRHRLIACVMGALVLGACADGRQPVAPDAPVAELEGFVAKPPAPPPPPPSSGNPQAFVLRQASSAPTLERYSASFWAVKGKDRTLEVRYTESNSSVSNRPFLRLIVYEASLDRDTNGKRLRTGDSLLISVQIDPATFRVDFEPSGLAFNTSKMPSLRLSYSYADLDVDRDGDVDPTDALILESATNFYHYTTTSSPWTLQPTIRNNFERYLEMSLPGFSGYAVSW